MGTTVNMNGLRSLATYSQKAVTFLLIGATCYYGTALVHSSYILHRRRKERLATDVTKVGMGEATHIATTTV